jgi:hypothetical protein
LPGFVEANAAELVSLVLETLPTYHLRTQQRAVNRVLRAALAQEPFLRALAPAVIKASSAKLPPQHAFSLLEWTCLLLEQLPADGKAVGKLLEVQAQLLDACYQPASPAAGTSHHWAAAKRIVLRLLRVRPELQPQYLHAAAASGSPGLVAAALAAALQQRQRQRQQQQQQQQQADPEAAASVLLPVLCDKVLADKVPPQPGVLAAYAPLLAVLSAAQLQDKLLPAASRAMRRTPEPAITALAGTLQHVQLDMSSSALELSGLLLQQLRAKEAVRRVAGQALSALAGRVADPGVALQLVQSVSSVLDGSKEGKVKVAAERTALANALAALAPLPAVPGMEQPATAAASFCSTYYKEERESLQQQPG